MGLFIRTALFTLVAPVMVMGVIPYLIALRYTWMRIDLGPVKFLGLLLMGIAWAIYLWCAADFMRAQGTPAPVDPPKELVMRGLYRYVRNPMYVGVMTGIAGWAVWFGEAAVLVYGVFGFILVHSFVTLYEEPHLRKVFGQAYDEYCKSVPRWIPKIPE
jgi:protein-S-isoprenylcysteine O-methyltransferase Ste14